MQEVQNPPQDTDIMPSQLFFLQALAIIQFVNTLTILQTTNTMKYAEKFLC